MTPTLELLSELGFKEDINVIGLSCVSWRVPSLWVEATESTDRFFRRGVLLSGVLATRREMKEIESWLPLEMSSVNEAAAWAWFAVSGGREPDDKLMLLAPWSREGYENRELLPWERERAEYERWRAEYACRPRCYVSRDWLKLAIRALRPMAARWGDDVRVSFAFDGKVLLIRTPNSVIPLPAEGDPWSEVWTVSAPDLSGLPTRLGQAEVEIAIWEEALQVSNRRVGSATPEPSPRSRPTQ